MNSFGLNKKGINTFGLGQTYSIITDHWKDAIRFSVMIKRNIRFNVEF